MHSIFGYKPWCLPGLINTSGNKIKKFSFKAVILVWNLQSFWNKASAPHIFTAAYNAKFWSAISLGWVLAVAANPMPQLKLKKIPNELDFPKVNLLFHKNIICKIYMIKQSQEKQLFIEISAASAPTVLG